MKAARAGVLYLSHDGVLEPLGRSQILGYLVRLAGRYRIHLLTFEKPGDLADSERVSATEKELRQAGISWRWLRYHNQPPLIATAIDLRRAGRVADGLVRDERLEIIHARSYVPSVLALRLKRRHGSRFLFDMRGLWADDRVEIGAWSRRHPLYGLAKHYERRFFAAADHIVSLTESGKRLLGNMIAGDASPPVSVIPTCVDTDRFRPAATVSRARGPTVGYVGTVAGCYRFAEVARFFALMCDEYPEARLVVLNRGQHASIHRDLRQAGVSEDRVLVDEVHHEDVPAIMATFDLGIFFIEGTPSKRFSAPTKLAEFLACGVPIIANAGYGDIEDILDDGHVGCLLPDLSEASLSMAVRSVRPLVGNSQTRLHCREIAVRRFSVQRGAEAYHNIYRELVRRR